MPLVWVIAWIFIRKSIALEQAEVVEAAAAVSTQEPISPVR